MDNTLDTLKLIIVLIAIIIAGYLIYQYLAELKHEMVPKSSPWAKTTPIDPIIPIFSIIAAAFIFFRRCGRRLN